MNERDPITPLLPAWAAALREQYACAATNTFLLHGNINDRFAFKGEGGLRLGALEDFLASALLGNFELIFTYDAGNGLRIAKGAKLWQGLTQQSGTLEALPGKAPRTTIEYLTHAARYLANLARAAGRDHPAACIVRDVNLIAPNLGAAGYNSEVTPAMLLLREWSREELITSSRFAAFLLAENLSDLHPVLAQNPRAFSVQVPLPDAAAIEQMLRARDPQMGDSAALAAALQGASAALIESTLRLRQHRNEPLRNEDLVGLKKAMVEREAGGLIEFLPPKLTLDDLHGQEPVKAVLRRDIALWTQGQIETCPMGYLICGPVGTGKTYLVRCLAGEAGIPVVRIKNFRDRWVGSSEANLERIFRLLKALGRCFVFIDEADQALGKRDSGDTSGVSSRVYSQFAEEMSNTDNRGKILWVLASSRPDLIEVDLKRPGRIDLRIPLFPTVTAEESFALLRALCARNAIPLNAAAPADLGVPIPILLTAGAADAVVREARKIRDFEQLSNDAALAAVLRDYSPPVPHDVLERQIAITVQEASELRFVPEPYRKYRHA